MRLCVPITARTLPEALDDIREANKVADLIELRLDYLDTPSPENIQKLIDVCDKPVIATYRKDNAIPILKSALDAGADYIDVEEITPELPLDRCIYSVHLKDTPPLEEMYRSMKASGAAIIKIVPTANTFMDNLAVLNLLEQCPEDQLIAFCMGEKGVISRYFAPAHGSFCTFGALSKSKESAPGQPLAIHLKKRKVNQKTSVCGVIGDPIAQSLSPAIHQAAYEKDGLDFLFLPFHVKKEELSDILNFMRQFPLKGLAVTIPHKEAVIPLLDEVDEEAQSIGAVNTIVNDKGKLKGYNTDIIGAVKPLKKRIDLKGKRALILGGGGAAKAFVYGLQKEGAEVKVLGRNPDKLKNLNCQTGTLEELENELPHTDILIQTTPVGMSPHIDKTLVPTDFLHKGLLVFDCVYNPLKTRLLKDAQAKRCETISGLEMFIGQACKQYKLFTGQTADVEVMRGVMLSDRFAQ